MSCNSNRKHVKSDQIFWGLIFIAGGTFMLLGQFGIGDFGWSLHKFWPLFVVIIGVSKLFQRKSVWGGLWMITLGAWLQAVTLHIYGFTYESSWPLLLVIFGAGLILRTVAGALVRRDTEERENDHV
jgi:hypothetical protein